MRGALTSSARSAGLRPLSKGEVGTPSIIAVRILSSAPRYQAIFAVMPPSTTSSAPVMYLASSLARKSAA